MRCLRPPGAAPLPRLFAVAACLAAHGALALVPLQGVYAAEPPPPLPILAIDPVQRGTVVESHADALSHWMAQGIADAVLLHVDAVGGLGSPQADAPALLKSLQQRGDFDQIFAAGRRGAAGPFDDGNYLRTAVALGVVRHVVWIIPIPLPGADDSNEGLKTFLLAEGLSSSDIAALRLAEGCYRGTLGTLSIAICDQDHLPRLDVPVLLSIGADFFPAAAGSSGLSVLTTIRTLFTSLRAARYAVRDATVISSMQAEEWPVELRWVAQALLEALGDPGLTLREEPPERWRLLEKLAVLRRGGASEEGEMLNLALSLLERNPHDPALLLFAAQATATHGGGSAALSYAEQACSVDPGYCVGLRELGLAFCNAGDCETGERFFTAAERRRPGMTHRQYEVGIALWLSGRTTEAVAALEQVVRHGGAWPSGFVLGAMHAALGDRSAARRCLDEAVAAMDRAPAIAVAQREVADAVQRAVVFYREEGLTQIAERLETDPRLRGQPPPP